MTKREYHKTIRDKEDRRKAVSITVAFNENFEISEKVSKHLEEEIAMLAAWVFRHLKEK